MIRLHNISKHQFPVISGPSCSSQVEKQETYGNSQVPFPLVYCILIAELSSTVIVTDWPQLVMWLFMNPASDIRILSIKKIYPHPSIRAVWKCLETDSRDYVWNVILINVLEENGWMCHTGRNMNDFFIQGGQSIIREVILFLHSPKICERDQDRYPY